jgi:sugar phosphate isomerase/epimerase
MYRNLNTAALGITGRQSELIELALTYGFSGLDMDLSDVVKRARSRGLDSARRYVASAGLRMGEFLLGLDWRTSEVTYRTALLHLKETAGIAAALGASSCTAAVEPYGSDLPYHEDFELHRRRLGEVGEILAAHDIRLGVALPFVPPDEEDRDRTPFIRQPETLLTLIKTVGSRHVGLTLDTWTWHVAGGTLTQLCAVPADQIVAVRFADAPADTDLASLTDQDRLLPGEGGGIDCAAILRHLAEHDFAGPLTLYPHASRLRGMTRDAIVQRARDALDTLFRSAGVNRTGQVEPLPAPEPEHV